MNRPPFVVAFAADMQGCGLHRIFLPLASMVETGAADGRADMAPWPADVGMLCAPDTVVWQRQVEEGQIETMRQWRERLPHVLFVYELDDYLGEIPKESFHAGFMPPDIAKRVADGIAFCDRVTTTTEPLAEWLRSLGARDVRVVPNGLPQQRLRERKQREGRLRVGWAGGISHKGDLEILRHAMAEIGEAVEWVFMGMRPENPPCRVEFRDGMAAHAYMDGIAALDLDLMLAPLEDNPFNRCKSNLRLVEAGAVCAAVIAQALPPYHVDSPPVFGYAESPSDWAEQIKRFIGAPVERRQKSADRLRDWVGNNYTLEKLLPRRMEAWTDVARHRFRPQTAKERMEPPVVACAEPDLDKRLDFLGRSRVVPSLDKACQLAISLGTDVLWLRPATTFDGHAFDSLREASEASPGIASTIPLASDGPNAFPIADKWMPMPAKAATDVAEIVRDETHGRLLTVAVAAGPAVLLARQALGMLGAPDVDGCAGNEEQAVMEWSLRATQRGWKHLQVADAFAASLAPPAQPTPQVAVRLQARGLADGLKNKSEELTADERRRIEFALLRRQWGGPRPGSMGFGTDYEAWSILRAAQKPPADGSDIDAVAEARLYQATFGDEGIPLCEGRWFVFRDDTVEVTETGPIAKAILAAGPDVRVVYADHETRIGDRLFPEFKPDFDPELLLAQDYVTPVCAVHVSVLEGHEAPLDRNALYAVLLRLPPEAFVHMPQVCGRMTVDPKPEALGVDTLSRQLAVEAVHGDAVKVEPHGAILGCLRVTRRWSAHRSDAPMVSIVIPTLGAGRLIQPCIATLLQHTRYPNFEVLVVQNGARATPELLPAVLADPRVRLLRWEPAVANGGFNWSALNNRIVREHALGEFVVTLNDDVCAASPDWLDAMMGHAVRPETGAVGARLIHPAGIVQHVGVLCHRGVAAHMHGGLPNGQPGHLGRAMLTHEASAVTGACMLFSRADFEALGGFDEDLPSNYNDVDFCLRLRALGRRIVVEATAELLHNGAASRGGEKFDPARFAAEGKALARMCRGDDPYWNPNLSLTAPFGAHTQPRGVNAEVLEWRDFVASPDAERVLLLNDLPGKDGLALELLDAGAVPMAADLSGFALRLTAPNLLNANGWDVRDPVGFADAMRALGVTRIVLRSLVGAAGAAPPVESLRALDPLLTGIPVEVRPTTPGAVAPWLAPDGGEGARRMFGHVDMTAWRDAYERLAGDAVKESA